MLIEIEEPRDQLDDLKMEVGDVWEGQIVDIDAAPHYIYGTTDQKYNKKGDPMTKWVMRLRKKGATDPLADVKFWAQSQVKFELKDAIRDSGKPANYPGADIAIKRLPNKEPSQPGFKGAMDYRFKITPGPNGWVDPLKKDEPSSDPFGDIDGSEPF